MLWMQPTAREHAAGALCRLLNLTMIFEEPLLALMQK